MIEANKIQKLVKQNIMSFRTKTKKENIIDYAKDKRLNLTKPFANKVQTVKAINKINFRLNEVFAKFQVDAKQIVRQILGTDSLFTKFSKRDRFNLTFSNKFQMARKRIRKQVRDEIIKTSSKGASITQSLDAAQYVWETTSEFSKFISYIVAEAYNFKLYEEIFETSETGKLEIVLNENHKHTDVCNHRAGTYDIGDSGILPPFHPYCLCYVRKV